MPTSEWIESHTSWSGEEISGRQMRWILSNRKRLLKAAPQPESRFCKIVDCMKFRMLPEAKRVLFYHRQKPFVVTPEFVFFGDFFFKQFKLLVEIDGAWHSRTLEREKDAIRSKLLSSHGIVVKRFRNEELTRHHSEIEREFLEAVMAVPGRRKLKNIVWNSIHHSHPPRLGSSLDGGRFCSCERSR